MNDTGISSTHRVPRHALRPKLPTSLAAGGARCIALRMMSQFWDSYRAVTASLGVVAHSSARVQREERHSLRATAALVFVLSKPKLTRIGKAQSNYLPGGRPSSVPFYYSWAVVGPHSNEKNATGKIHTVLFLNIYVDTWTAC